MRFAALIVVLAVLFTSRSAQAACECYQSDGTTPGGGYLALVSVPCTSTPPGYAWIKPRNLSSNDPSANLHIAVPASWTWNGCTYVDFMFRDTNAVPRIVMFDSGIVGCSTQPPNVQPDFMPPDSERQATWCESTYHQAVGFGSGATCQSAQTRALSAAKVKAEARAASICPSSVICGSTTNSRCFEAGFHWFDGEAAYNFSCFATYNICR